MYLANSFLIFCRHMTATLALGWRRRLTSHLSNLYFQNYGFYKVTTPLILLAVA